MEQLDVTMTAVMRPEIIDITLKSFFRRAFHDIPHVRLIVNIDPIGSAGATAQDVKDVCLRYNANCVFFTPDQPSFPAAVQRVWSRSDTPFVFHLEDDWLLRKKIYLDDAAATLAAIPDLGSLRFYLRSNPTILPRASRPSLNPGLFKREFIQAALSAFSLEHDPEKQFGQHEPLVRATSGYWHAMYGAPNAAACVTEIGRHSRRRSGFDKTLGLGWSRQNSNGLNNLWLRFKGALYQNMYAVRARIP